jgi:hypothetical protein
LVEWTDGAVTSPVATVVATVSNVFEEVAPLYVAAFGTGRFIFRAAQQPFVY